MYRVLFVLKVYFCCTLTFTLIQVSLLSFHHYIAINTWRKKSFSKTLSIYSVYIHVVHFLTTFTLLPFISRVVTCLFYKKTMMPSTISIYFFVQLLRYFFVAFHVSFLLFSTGSDSLQNHEPLKNAIILVEHKKVGKCICLSFIMIL